MDRSKLGSKAAHHGRTPAAWTGSALALIGFIVGLVGFLAGPNGFPSINWPVVYVGLGLIVLAPIVGGILNRAGQGQDA